MNMKIHLTAIKSDVGTKHLADLVRLHGERRIHIQFNVVDSKMSKAKNPRTTATSWFAWPGSPVLGRDQQAHPGRDHRLHRVRRSVDNRHSISVELPGDRRREGRLPQARRMVEASETCPA